MPGLNPRRKLGQHFLVDDKVIDYIIRGARFEPNNPVIEIGPGRGALTLPLARVIDHLFAVEKDSRLTDSLRKRLKKEGMTNVTLINEDILKWDFQNAKERTDSRLQVIGNLPYSISSPILYKLIENRSIIGRAILMFQLEVAERLTAVPSKKAYGALTLFIQYYASVRPLIRVNKKSFYPSPKVDSMVIELDFTRPYPERTTSETDFKTVVNGAFAHRRKTILNSLKNSIHNDVFLNNILTALEKCGIDPSRRAETLHMDEFLCLIKSLNSKK